MAITLEERDFAAKHLAESRERFLHLVRGLTAKQLDYKPALDRWSVAENLEHVVLVERRATAFVETAIAQPEDPSKGTGYPGNNEGLIAMIRDRSHPRRGPEQVQPRNRWQHEQLLREFEAARKQTCDFILATTADLHARFAPHPVFGDLDCYQWVLVISAHSDRHRAQAEEVMASPGFPRLAAAV